MTEHEIHQGDRLSVPEAAERLGVTQDAVRKRIHRDAISWEQDGDGRYYVYLGDTEDTTRNTSRETRQDTSRDTLIVAMQDQIDTLKQEVADWKEEARRKDHLLAAALERIPALEEPTEPRQSPESAGAGSPGSTEPYEEQEKQTSRPWWRRVFGG
jgi:hypothetical protein